MVRKERLELSHPKILEPKSSASTNSATSAMFLSRKRLAGVPGFEPGNGGIKTRCLTAWRYSNIKDKKHFSSALEHGAEGET